MTDEEFKRQIESLIKVAIDENGGIMAIRRAHGAHPGMHDFLVGWVAHALWCYRQAACVEPRTATFVERRRIHDLVRLKLDTDSVTS